MLDLLKIESRAVRNSARGEDCTLQIEGVCNGDPATTVFAHLPDESNGMGTKSDDVSGCYSCSACHDVCDGRAPWPRHEAPWREWYFRRAQNRTQRRLIQRGIVHYPGVS